MRKPVVVAVSALSLATLGHSGAARAQVICAPGFNISLKTQADVDSFPQDCDDVPGNLFIGPSSDITDLSPLSGVTSVGTFLDARENSALTSFALPALTSVGQDLNINRNSALTSVDLPALTSVGGFLFVADNNALTSLALPELATTRDFLVRQASLTNLDLPALSSVEDSLAVRNNTALACLTLPALNSVGGGLNVANTAVTSLTLPVLEAAGGQLSVLGNANLTSIDLPALESVGGLIVGSNPRLSDCCGLLPILDADGISGPVDLHENAPGCNSEAEIRAACAVPMLPPLGLVLFTLLLFFGGAFSLAWDAQRGPRPLRGHQPGLP